MAFSAASHWEAHQRGTHQHMSQKIRDATRARLVHYANHPEFIDDRLAELDREWDIERIMEANAAAIGLTGLCLAATVSRKWLILPAIVTGFLLQHTIQGWSPPLPVLRRLGFRTPGEISDERNGLIDVRNQLKRTVRGEDL